MEKFWKSLGVMLAGLVLFFIYIAIPLGIIYGLVRFVKWAWV